MLITLNKPKTYVNPDADLNIKAPIIPNEVSWGNGPNGPKPEKLRKAEQLVEKGLAVKEKIYDMFMENDAKFLRDVMRAKPEASLSLLGKILPSNEMGEQVREQKMPVLIINNTGPAQVNVEAA